MRFLSLLPSLLLAGAAVAAENAWSFKDATVSVVGKSSKGGFKESLSTAKPLSKDVPLGPTDNLKLILTTTASTPQRPHQAFLILRDPTTGLESAFPLQVRDTGKAKLELSHRDLPVQFLTAAAPLTASLVLGSFGAAAPLRTPLFTLAIATDPAVPEPRYDAPLRYGRAPEIHHIFAPEQAPPPVAISVVFVGVILATLPLLLGAWALLGANLAQLPKALGAAPVSHVLFFGSLLAMEGVFAMYYWRWSLFRVLPVAGAVAAVAFVSGSKALSEVQARRLKGER